MQKLALSNLSVPKTLLATFPIVDSNRLEKSLGGYPIILKKTSGTQGDGVVLIRDQSHLLELNDLIDRNVQWIFQEFISFSSGRDLRVIVIGGRVVGAMQREAKHGFRANFHKGGSVKQFELDTTLEYMAQQAAKECLLGVTGIDILFDEHEMKICEVNASPGFEGFELATSINVAYLILQHALRVSHKTV